MCNVLVSHGTEYTIVWWIRATMDGRVAVAILDGLSVWLAISRCFPQRGVLLPLLWCLVVDDLLARFSEGGVFVQGYTDDTCLLAVGKFPNTVSGLMQWALSTAGIWRNEVGQSVNTDESGLVSYNRKRKFQGFFEPQFFEVKLSLSGSVKFLGIILDSPLTWRERVEVKVRKAYNLLWDVRGGLGSETHGGPLALCRHRSADHLSCILSMGASKSSA